jgi:hypothetical protein
MNPWIRMGKLRGERMIEILWILVVMVAIVIITYLMKDR